MKIKGFGVVLLGLSLCVSLAACNGGASDGVDADQPYFDMEKLPEDLRGMVEMDLSEHGLPLVILVPDSSVGVPRVTVQPYGETEIKVGRGYWITIAEGGDMELQRQDVDEDLLYKSNYLEDESCCILYRSVLPDDELHEEHHFYVVKNIDGVDYEIRDKPDGSVQYSERAARSMLEAARAMVARRSETKPDAS